MKPVRKTMDIGDLLESFANNLETQSVINYVPHPKQLTFHSSDKEEKLFIGGNRSGKTVANIVECIWWLTKTHPYRPEVNSRVGPTKGRLVCVSFIDGLEKIILPLFKQWMPNKYLTNRSWDDSYSTRTRTLTLADGSFIEFMSYDQELEKFAGTSRDFVSYDEEPPMTVWQECLLRLMDTDGSWWISMTPVEGVTWVYREIYKRYKDGKRPNTLIVEVNSRENPHLNKRAMDKIMDNLTEEERKIREGGEFEINSHLIYKNFDREVHVKRHFEVTPEWRVYTSLDSGFRHPAAWLWHAVHPTGRIITFHEIVVAEHSVEQLAAKVTAYEDTYLRTKGIEVYMRTGDPALKQTREHTGTSVLQEYGKHGINIGVEGVPRSVDIGIIRITQYLANTIKLRNTYGAVSEYPMWQVDSSCTILIDEMEKYRWDKHASRKMEYDKAPKDVPLKKDDDAVDSLRYFMTLMDDLSPDRIEQLKNVTYEWNGTPVSQFSSYTVPPVQLRDNGPRVFQSSNNYEESWY